MAFYGDIYVQVPFKIQLVNIQLLKKGRNTRMQND